MKTIISLLIGLCVAGQLSAADIKKAHIKPHITIAKYHNMVVFGDSLSDIKGKATNNDPAGKLLWDEDLYADLGDKLGQRNGIFSYPASKENEACHNANNCNIVYAVGGNTTKNLAAQISNYKNQLQGQGANENTIVFIWLGGNDFKAFQKFEDSPENATQRIKDGINQLVNELGVKPEHIFLLNLPNIGKMPLLAGDTLEDKLAQTAAASTTLYYNNLLKTVANQTHTHIIDIHAHDADIHANLSKYGYDVIATEKRQSCNSYATNKQTCTSDNGYFMYYDSVHPTVYTHKNISDYIVKQL